jgi:hypothetical protein
MWARKGCAPTSSAACQQIAAASKLTFVRNGVILFAPNGSGRVDSTKIRDPPKAMAGPPMAAPPLPRVGQSRRMDHAAWRAGSLLMNCSTHSPVICLVAALIRFQVLIVAIEITSAASWASS